MMIERRHFLAAGATSAAAAVFPNLLLQGAEKPRLKYVQIGTTHPHADKIKVYRASKDWEVIGVVEPDLGRRKQVAGDKNYEGLPFLELDQALATPGLNCVGVETDIRDLLTHAEAVVDAGFHMHIDKPAGESLAHYTRIMKKADAKGLVAQMGYMYRFNPAVQFLHQCLEDGWLGEVFETHAVMSKVMPPASRKAVAEYPGGTMFELGGHIIDLTVGVLGKPDKVTAFPKQVISGQDSLQDNMLAVFDYPKATATVKSSAVEVDGFARRHFVVCGTGGTCHIQPLDRPKVKLSLSEERKASDGRIFKKGSNEVIFDPPYQRYVGDAADLAATIRGEQPNRFPSTHDLAVQEAVIRASALPLSH